MTELLNTHIKDAPADGLDLLDDLIVLSYLLLKDKLEYEIKIGDFLKMIELRRKLAPKNQDKQELWNLLRKIRNESTQEHPITTAQPAEPNDSDQEDQ